MVPQFIMGTQNMVADSLSHCQQVLGSERTLAQDVVNDLQVMWPITVDLFATTPNYWLLVCFSPLNDPMAVGMDAFLQVWDSLQAYASPPFALIRQVSNKLRTCKGRLLTLIAPFWPQKAWFFGSPESLGSSFGAASFTSRFAQAAVLSSPAPEPPHAAPSCVAIVQQFAPT